MTYSNEIQKDNIEVNYFIHIGYRTYEVENTWATIKDNFVSMDWFDTTPGLMKMAENSGIGTENFMQPQVFRHAASIDDLANNRIYASGQESYSFFHDRPSNKMYANFGFSPTGFDYLFYFEHYLFLSTKHMSWNLYPDKANYPKVQYQGLLLDQPTIKSSVSEGIFGFFPSYQGTVTFRNDNKYFSEQFLLSSISNCTFDVYRCVGEIKTENMQLAFRGFCRTASYDDDKVTIQYVDASVLLDEQLNNGRFGDGRQFEVIEPNVAGAVRRAHLCGQSNRIAAADTNYDDAVANVYNRTWCFGTIFSGVSGGPHADFTTKNASVGSNTTTRTYLDSVTGIKVDDLLSVNSSATIFLQVTSIGSDYINHTTLGGALGASDYLRKWKVQNIRILDKTTGIVSPVPKAQIYSCDPASKFISLVFQSSLDSNLGFATALHPTTHNVIGDVLCGVGALNFPGVGAALGAVNTATGYNQNPVQLIYELLYQAGFKDYGSWYDQASFVAAAAAVDINIDACSPLFYNSTDEESYRDLLAKVCLTAQLKVYLKNGKWYCDMIGVMGAADHEVKYTNVMDGFSFELKTDDVLKYIGITYDPGELNLRNEFTQDSERSVSTYNSTSEAINGTNRSRTFRVFTQDQAAAEIIRDRILSIFSVRLGYLTMRFDLSKMPITLADIIEVDPENIPGMPFTSLKKFAVLSIKENSDTIEVEMFDQAGIEQYFGVWP